ncbi:MULTISPECIES: hypothetical protein [unclassified Novosphingobium]|uniref:hypothetical protein n=1 Tax=unclassified Novosphingobium TaxID=2644732 RepID=UPI0009EA2CCE|nr:MULTISPECIES: hypothetical protein [unclassified Novosphingobium]MBB3360371.1 hypothetical protein [Novosphingobium sp. BK256]MBB3376710.1 hypothetical protein [Novosphingobium sp. BK280]MBB3381123.1 hypothetical protein [Novosphingobium sp. BK258]MBB3422774.1 hypothetical protein [Novosphingobium sp. BK267]MBB3451482.1 hypothetical protein [Novosphingobium sp. BK352]
MLLQPKCPYLNPVEIVWQFVRNNWLSNQNFKLYDDIVVYSRFAWNKLFEHLRRIVPLRLRQRTHGF